MNKERKLKLNNQLEIVKNAFENPKLYLSNHFSDLRNKVDIAYATQEKVISSDSDSLKLLNVNWQETIEKIDSFEKSCFKFEKKTIFTNELEETIRNSIQKIESKLLQINSPSESNEDEDKEEDDDYEFDQNSDLIYDSFLKLAKVLFTNKTMIFLVKKKIPIYKHFAHLSEQYPNAYTHKNVDLFKSLDDTKAGLLIFITNEYCGSEATDQFERLAFYDSKITREIALCKQLKKVLDYELKNDHIYETEFGNFKSFDLERSSEEVSHLDALGKRVEIASDVFLGSDKIEYVDLANNIITCLEPNIFASLVNLKQLNLKSCRLSQLKVGTFNGLVNLKELFLFNNLFYSISANVFSGLTNVEYIYLTSCKNLSQVDGNAFKGLNKLIKIDMGHCKIRTIDLEPFKNLASLQCLVINIDGLKKSKEYKFYIC